MGYRDPESGQWVETCFNKLKPGEPYFVLRAQDTLASSLVRAWASLAKANGLSEEKFPGRLGDRPGHGRLAR